MNRRVRNLTRAAIIAALYAVLTHLQNLLLPGSATWAIQCRLSEALCVLAFFTPAAIPGLTVGCLLANIVSFGALPMDMLFGTLASFLAALSMYALRRVTFKGLPLLSLAMPAVFNGIIVGAEIEAFFIEGPFRFSSFFIQGGCVAIGELGVLFTLGIMLVKIIRNKKLEKYL